MATMRAVLAAEPGGEPGRLAEIDTSALPAGDVTVRVSCSSLNYKDGLAVTGRGRVVRQFPMICGIDLAGTVEASDDARVAPGDEVIVTGWGLGEARHGGYAELARVEAGWVVPLPDGLDARSSMAIGTAGLTAMLAVMSLERHGLTRESAGDFPVLVTGAAGGVGSVAVALLARLGYGVTALSGRAHDPEHASYLHRLGASDLLPREELEAAEPRPLGKERFAAAIDVVGGRVLATALSQVRYGGCVAACGLAGGSDLPTTVLPFILRGVDLAGIESVRCPTPTRLEAWGRLSTGLPAELREELTVEASLEDVPRLAEEILAGSTRGRVVVRVAD